MKKYIKYSLIVPVYNTENYLRSCLDSILKQTYDNFEVLVYDDGSTDGSFEILEEYKKLDKRFKIKKEYHCGLSMIRNKAISAASGEYLIFVDSDATINEHLLEELSKYNDDVIRYQCAKVYSDRSIDYLERVFSSLSGDKAFAIIAGYHFVEVIWTYAIRKSFYENYGFYMAPGKFHEDFALVPLIIMSAMSVSSISYVGYNYFIRKNSIMTTKDYNKTRKKCFDMLDHYITLKKAINLPNYNELNKKVFLNFISNSVIIKMRDLNKEDYKIYYQRLKKLKVKKDILGNSIPRLLKKILMNISMRLYLKVAK